MIEIEINERKYSAEEGETILQALKRAGIKVPTLCHVECLPPSGACRMCVVEVEGMRGLVTSCSYPVAEGMKIRTNSARAVRARKTVVELLLANHPDDCLYCVRNGACELQELAEVLGVRQRRYSGKRGEYKMDVASPSIERDPAKCILCGRCVRVCEEIQGVAAIDFIGRGSRTTVGTAFDDGINVSSCVNCGQCITACPTGALREQSNLKEVLEAIKDPEMTVVVQHAPAVSVSLGEEFGLKPGTDVDGVMTTTLRKLGFKYVFDTSFSADLTIMEEASELVHRVKTGGTLPMMTSCSPGWIKYVEEFFPEMIPNLSSCKSPQQMMGAVIKHFWAQREGVDPAKVCSVSIMPCTAKKFEAARPEMGSGGVADVDAVLTTRELARFIRLRGLEMESMEPETADNPFGVRSTAGKLFGATGGVMEAALRSAYWMITGEELQDLTFRALRGMEGTKMAEASIDGLKVKVAVVNGLGNARKLIEEVKAGKQELHFIEVMTCPGGCIGGGGQPYGSTAENLKSRMDSLYKIDRSEPMRQSHQNPWISRLYKEFLGEPLGEKSHHLLHTSYARREVPL